MSARHSTRRRDTSGHVDPYFQRRRRYEAALKPLGLWTSFAAMPRGMQDQFFQHKFPDPVLDFDASFPSDDEHRLLRKMLESAFRGAVMDIEGAAVTVRDFFSIIAGLKYTVQGARNQPVPEECSRFMREAWPRLNRWYEPGIPAAWVALHAAVVGPLVARSRLDARLWTAGFKQDMKPNDKFVIRMIVSATEPQVRQVRLDGAARPIYRVGTTNEWDLVRWLSWDAQKAGFPGARREYPVYVQSHALRHLHQRVNLPRMAPYLEYWLYESLKNPCIVERQGEDLLVVYRIRKHRIGYLIVTPVKDDGDEGGLVAVRTFKFLTMENTPEARMLRQRLRLTRRDVDWLGLSDLAAFTQTDLAGDVILRPLLEACGCGHLFELRDESYAPLPEGTPFAAELRRYLRMAA